MNEPTITLQHGNPIESWTIHTHQVIFKCPCCNNLVLPPRLSFYKLDVPHVCFCSCGQSFGIKWLDETQDAQVTFHTWIDIDIPETEEGDW